jgi:WD40 repeat protein
MHGRPSVYAWQGRSDVHPVASQATWFVDCNFRVSRTRRQEEEQEDFVTTGLDGTMRFWNCEHRCQTRCRVMGLEGRSIDVSQDGSLVAVGHSAGQFSVWETRRLQCIYLNSNTKADVHCLRYSQRCPGIVVERLVI